MLLELSKKYRIRELDFCFRPLYRARQQIAQYSPSMPTTEQRHMILTRILLMNALGQALGKHMRWRVDPTRGLLH